MAIRSGMFNSVGGDRKYQAANFAEYFASFIGNGVFPNPSNGLQITTGSNMRIVMKSGKAWINGYYFINDADHSLTLDVADGQLKRIDRIVLRLNFSNREIIPAVKKGTNASSPVAPTIQRNTDMYEIVLADVLVNNGVTSISQANITDQRMNKELCGIVAGVVNQIDTTNLFAQYETAFNQWFVTVRDTLDGDVAANLANQIQTVRNDLETHKNANASLTTKGHVQLSSATNSTNELLAATPRAVKIAMDRADSAFQSANDGKTAVANAVTAKGVSASPTDTFSVLASKIGQISTGKKFASGITAASSPSGVGLVVVRSLDFVPSVVVSYCNVGNWHYHVIAYNNTKFSTPFKYNRSGTVTDLGAINIESGTSTTTNLFSSTSPLLAFNSDGFTIPAPTVTGNYTWLAFE